MKQMTQINNSIIHSNSSDQRKAEDYLDLLEEVVKTFQNSGEPEEDLMQVGYLGLLNAVNLYRDEIDHSFQEYASQLISGEVRHYIREKYKSVKVPDWLSVMMNKLLNQMLVAYCKQHHKFPDLQELSQMLDLSPEILKEAMKAREAVLEISIDQKRRENDIKEPLDIAKINKAIKRKKNEQR